MRQSYILYYISFVLQFLRFLYIAKYLRVIIFLIAMNMGSVMVCTCACGGVRVNEDNGHQCTCNYVAILQELPKLKMALTVDSCPCFQASITLLYFNNGGVWQLSESGMQLVVSWHTYRFTDNIASYLLYTVRVCMRVPLVTVWGMMWAVNDGIDCTLQSCDPTCQYNGNFYVVNSTSTKAPTLAIGKYNKILVQACYHIW